MQILTLNVSKRDNCSPVTGFSLQIRPGRKWITGFSRLIAKRYADAVRTVQQTRPATYLLRAKPQASAISTVGFQGVEIKKCAPCATARANEKRLPAERHLPPLHGNDLRRALTVSRREKPDVIAGGFDALKWKAHRLSKCTMPSQRTDIYFAAMIGSDRMRWFAVTHAN
jgi:hypothetical protein